jgi:hypothetical protein
MTPSCGRFAHFATRDFNIYRRFLGKACDGKRNDIIDYPSREFGPQWRIAVARCFSSAIHLGFSSQ